MKLLDYDTGGGEFLLTLTHPFENTSATEGMGRASAGVRTSGNAS